MNIVLTVMVLVAALGFLTMATVYLGWHKFRVNIFTWLMATLTLSLAGIMTYVGYNVLAQDFGWPVASGTAVAYAVYTVLACVGTFGAFVFIRETFLKSRRSK